MKQQYFPPQDTLPRGAGRSATGPLVLQDGHLVPLLPKGASIFLSMSLQRLTQEVGTRARTASTPNKSWHLKALHKCFHSYPGQSRLWLPFLGLSCSYIFLAHFERTRCLAAFAG